MIYTIGIDPGAAGAIVLMNERGEVLSISDTPTTKVTKGRKKSTAYMPTEMTAILENCIGACVAAPTSHTMHAFIENVHAMPGQGVRSMFNMGYGFGLWIGILAALSIPYTTVEPVKWKRDVNIPAGADKRHSAVRAGQLFPQYRKQLMRTERCTVPSDGRADALLIAEYGRRQFVKQSSVHQKSASGKRKRS